ncbi:MAG: chorismate synthase [Chloroflexota bacterium]
MMLRVLRMLTAGESHGQALVGVLEGMPAGLPLSPEDIDLQLRRRQGGHGRGGRMKIEKDHALLLSGVRHGLTLGSPIGLQIQNRDWANWQERMSVEPLEQPVEAVTRLRPGHADLPGALKYGHPDVRNVLERASARETAMRVALAAVARRLLSQFGIELRSETVSIGGVAAELPGWVSTDRRGAWGDGAEGYWQAVESSPVRCGDEAAGEAMVRAIDEARRDGDTLGGVFQVEAYGVPAGLGSHVQWDRKLSTRLSAALMSINSIKGVEVGAGFGGADLRGRAYHDVIDYELTQGWTRRGNSAGGIEGGMSNGEPIVLRCVAKPIPTLMKPLPSVDLVTKQPIAAAIERSDICVVPAAGVVGEAMVALVLADAFLEKFGGDSVEEIERNYRGYLERLSL